MAVPRAGGPGQKQSDHEHRGPRHAYVASHVWSPISMNEDRRLNAQNKRAKAHRFGEIVAAN
jgi:hypothetical protein